jgi:hypothetical protein
LASFSSLGNLVIEKIKNIIHTNELVHPNEWLDRISNKFTLGKIN